MLKSTKLAPTFSIGPLAEATDGFSGSDLREICRNAAMVPVREFTQSTRHSHKALVKGQGDVAVFALIENSQGTSIRFATFLYIFSILACNK